MWGFVCHQVTSMETLFLLLSRDGVLCLQFGDQDLRSALRSANKIVKLGIHIIIVATLRVSGRKTLSFPGLYSDRTQNTSLRGNGTGNYKGSFTTTSQFLDTLGQAAQLQCMQPYGAAGTGLRPWMCPGQ